MEDDEVVDKNVEFQSEHFDQSRWIYINAETVDNDNINQIDENHVNYTLGEQPADDISENNRENDINAYEPDDVTIHNDNTSSDTAEDDANDEVNEPDEEEETNHAHVPKELNSTLGNYWEVSSEQRVACVYLIVNLDDFV